MASSSISRRYARAVFELAPENKREEWLAEVRSLALSLSDPETRAFLRSPAISMADKQELLRDVSEKVKSEVQAFFLILLEHGRIDLIDEVIDELHRMIDRAAGRVGVDIIFSGPVSQAVKNQVVQFVESELDLKVTPTFKEDPSLLAGFRVEGEELQIDGSLSGQLGALKSELLASNL